MSDYPNDTPEADHRVDSITGGSLMPLKIDKASRYGTAGFFSRKHAPGKGEIRAHRDHSIGMRKRKRRNHDRDVGSVTLHRHAQDSEAWDSEFDTDNDGRSRSPTGLKQHQKQGRAKGALESFFYALNKYPNTPDHVQRWMQLGANLFLVSLLAYCGWSVVSTVRSDIYQANDLARQDLVSKIEDCQRNYRENECIKGDRPALRVKCAEWYDCMLQSPDSIMRVKVTAKQVAEIINEFSETMHLKAWVGSSCPCFDDVTNAIPGHSYCLHIGVHDGQRGYTRPAQRTQDRFPIASGTGKRGGARGGAIPGHYARLHAGSRADAANAATCHARRGDQH